MEHALIMCERAMTEAQMKSVSPINDRHRGLKGSFAEGARICLAMRNLVLRIIFVGLSRKWRAVMNLGIFPISRES